jgi:hypothetical protein
MSETIQSIDASLQEGDVTFTKKITYRNGRELITQEPIEKLESLVPYGASFVYESYCSQFDPLTITRIYRFRDTRWPTIYIRTTLKPASESDLDIRIPRRCIIL